MADYASNSQNKKDSEPAAEPKVEKVIEGKAIERKKSVGRRLAENFTGQSGRSVGDYIFWDLIVPQVKDLIFDVISGGAQKVLFGDGPTSRSWRSGSKGGYTPYSSMAGTALSKAAQNVKPAVIPSDTFGEILLETRPEAEATMEKIRLTIEQYGKASMGDLKASVGLTGNMTDENFGWYPHHLGQMSIRRVGGSQPGFALIFPDPEPL